MTCRQTEWDSAAESRKHSVAIGMRCDRDVIERGFIHEVFRNAI
jgi:hypothetical protein